MPASGIPMEAMLCDEPCVQCTSIIVINTASAMHLAHHVLDRKRFCPIKKIILTFNKTKSFFNIVEPR